MKILTIIFTLFALTACSPRIHYLGDSYPVKDKVEVFYDEGDIKRDFKVIGQLSSDNSETNVSLETMREKMIESAKEKGADAIWFLFHESIGNNHIIQAKLLLYK